MLEGPSSRRRRRGRGQASSGRGRSFGDHADRAFRGGEDEQGEEEEAGEEGQDGRGSKPTHFLAIRITDDGLLKNLVRIQKQVGSYRSSGDGITVEEEEEE